MAIDKAEILAPAGGPEQLVAAVRCGADAVYLGAKKFSARQNAVNFDDFEIQKAIDYCRLRGVKVYAALNTVLSDRELYEALRQAEFLTKSGVDAFIIQDLALAKEIKKYSNVPLHASTQASVGAKGGFAVLGELGFSRAVLPRELSFEEIKDILADCEIETECFVHGALCMSVSGQCYLSAMLGSRSGNRGLCAQPCRLPFGTGKDTDRFLSLKDLSLVSELRKLRDAGVTSFKIEGRMKRAEYVAAAVTACRAALEGELDVKISELLANVFSRSGFTQGHFEGKRNKTMFGIRQKEDVQKSASALGELKRLYEKEKSTVPVRFSFVLKENGFPELTATANGFTVEIKGEKQAQKAANKELTEDGVIAQLSKCGGTAFYAENAECEIQGGLALPVSELNSMRRRALEALENLIVSELKYDFDSVPEYEPSKKIEKIDGNQKIYALFPSVKTFKDGLADTVYLPLEECAADGFDAKEYKSKIFAHLPRMFFGREEAVRRLCEKAKENGVCGFLVGGLDGYAVVRDLELPIHSSFGLNVYSSLAAKILAELGISNAVLSPELTAKQIEGFEKPCKIGVFAYGRLPLMLTRACPMQNAGGCTNCSSPKLIDRKNVSFPVRCRFGFTEVLNSRPIYTADKLGDIKSADFILLYFTTETKEEAAEIINAYKNKLPPSGEFTRGLLYRGSI